jgi:hypothetical protein
MILDGHRDLECLIEVVECALSTGRLNHHAGVLTTDLSELPSERYRERGCHVAAD